MMAQVSKQSLPMSYSFYVEGAQEEIKRDDVELLMIKLGTKQVKKHFYKSMDLQPYLTSNQINQKRLLMNTLQHSNKDINTRVKKRMKHEFRLLYQRYMSLLRLKMKDKIFFKTNELMVRYGIYDDEKHDTIGFDNAFFDVRRHDWIENNSYEKHLKVTLQLRRIHMHERKIFVEKMDQMNKKLRAPTLDFFKRIRILHQNINIEHYFLDHQQTQFQNKIKEIQASLTQKKE
jgi:hypothetical protein